MNNIKAVIFDSGRVLNYPSTGHWFITPNFWEYVDKTKFESIDKNKIFNAFRKADEYIMTQKLIESKEDELHHFTTFYKIFSAYLPELQLEENQICLIAKDLVYNTDKYTFYDDALNIINKFYGKYKLAIVSDAWPSLLDVYDNNNLTDKFDCIVISSILGTTKPDPLMYLTALNKLNIEPFEAVFIDDSLRNCLGSARLGIHTFLLCRNKQAYISNKVKSIGKNYKVINTLNQLEKLL